MGPSAYLGGCVDASHLDLKAWKRGRKEGSGAPMHSHVHGRVELAVHVSYSPLEGWLTNATLRQPRQRRRLRREKFDRSQLGVEYWSLWQVKVCGCKWAHRSTRTTEKLCKWCTRGSSGKCFAPHGHKPHHFLACCHVGCGRQRVLAPPTRIGMHDPLVQTDACSNPVLLCLHR